jgi:hypothetical protein
MFDDDICMQHWRGCSCLFNATLSVGHCVGPALLVHEQISKAVKICKLELANCRPGINEAAFWRSP